MNRRRRPLTSATLFVAVVVTATARAEEKLIGVPITELGNKYQLLGRLEIPLGTMVTVQGVVAQGPFKGFEGGPILLVQRINRQATQKDIRINLDNYGHKYELHDDSTSKKIPRKLARDKTYEFYGHETGEFIGTPKGFVYEVPVQTVGYYLRESFHAEKGRSIEAISLGPADFIDREALLEGRAVTRNGQSLIAGDGWELLADADKPWPADVESKLAETYGLVRSTGQPNLFRLENGATRLVRLEDQVGHKVELRGTIWSLNGHWWFEYRDTQLYVDQLESLVQTSGVTHGSQAMVQGTLEEAMLPAIDQITEKRDRDLRKYFVVRNATIAPLKRPLLAPEKPKVEN